MSEQVRKIKHEDIPQWAQGLYYNKGLFSEALVYHDDEAIYYNKGLFSEVLVYHDDEAIYWQKEVIEDEQTSEVGASSPH